MIERFERKLNDIAYRGSISLTGSAVVLFAFCTHLVCELRGASAGEEILRKIRLIP